MNFDERDCMGYWDYYIDEGMLSEETAHKIDAFLEEYPDAAFGPAHIVLDDYNLSDGHIRWRMGLAKAALSGDTADLYDQRDIAWFTKTMEWYKDDDTETLAATVQFLEELLTVPEDER